MDFQGGVPYLPRKIRLKFQQGAGSSPLAHALGVTSSGSQLLLALGLDHSTLLFQYFSSCEQGLLVLSCFLSDVSA